MLKKYLDFVYKYKEVKPKFEVIKLSQKQNSFQFVGGQIANNKLYSIVNSSEKMLRYNLKTKEMQFLGEFSKTDFKWTGGCVYKNKLFSFPRRAKYMLTFDLKTGEFSEIFCNEEYEGEHHYGGALTSSGIVYQPPRSTNHILKWDLKTGKNSKIIINNGESCRYCGSVIHPNGFVYFIPEAGYNIIKMNLKTEEISYINTPFIAMAFDPTVAANGNIYGFCSDKGVLEIDVKNDTANLLYSELFIGAYGTKAGINGMLYSLPAYTDFVCEFNPFTGELKNCFKVEGENNVHFAGGATAQNGDIYALPVHADNILRLNFEEAKAEIPTDLYNAFFNDFY